MKFITEIDLRNLYRDEPFTSYEIEPETKLTPGARQFLIDKGINISEKNFKDSTKKQLTVLEKKKDWKKEKLISKMKSVEAIFLSTAEELLNIDILLSQNIIQLSKQFTTIIKAFQGEGSIKDIDCNECIGINTDNFNETLGDCFEITDFHIQLDRGKEIITLHRLRCALNEVEPAILEYCEDEEEVYSEGIEKVNQLINNLSQIICSIVGGKRCQRKS